MSGGGYCCHSTQSHTIETHAKSRHQSLSDAAAQQGWEENEEVTIIASNEWGPEPLPVKLTRAKLNVLERQGRTEDYLALCVRVGAHLRYAMKLVELGRVAESVKYAIEHPANASEAFNLAKQLHEAKQVNEALKVAERGLKLGGNKAAPGEWLGPLEEASGQTAQALAAWQAAFHDSPALEIRRTIKRLAG